MPPEIVEIDNFIANFVNKIHLKPYVKEHLLETEEGLKAYLSQLLKFKDPSVPLFLLDGTIHENIDSSKMENALYSPAVTRFHENILSTYPKISENLLFRLHEAVLENTDHPNPMKGNYRNCLAWVGPPGCTMETASFVPVKTEDISPLMKQFVDYCNSDSNTELDNMFIKSAIIHILFIKIHPFKDGNGRIARILHHHKLTELVNKKYGTNLSLPLINLSQHLELSRGNYYTYENSIVFNGEADNNDDWNRWFNYILNMIDEQLYFLTNKLQKHEQTMRKIEAFRKF